MRPNRDRNAGPPRVGESAQFQCFTPEATVEAAFALSRGELSAAVGTAVEIGSGEVSARVSGEFRAAESSLFAIEASVAPEWRIEDVTSVPADAIADWSLDAQPGGERRLTVHLAKSIGAERPLRLTVNARRLRLPSQRAMKLGDLQPLHYLPPVVSRRWLSLATVAGNELRIQGDHQPRQLLLADLPVAERELFSASSGELFFSEDGDADAEVVVESRRPEYSASVRMEAAAAGGRLHESWTIHCVPAAAPVEKILVRLSEKSETPPQWKLVAADALSLAARQLPVDAAAKAGSNAAAETWEIASAARKARRSNCKGRGKPRSRIPARSVWRPCLKQAGRTVRSLFAGRRNRPFASKTAA